MELVAENISDLSVLRRMLFASVFLPKDLPKYWETVSMFAAEGSRESIDPESTRLMMENLHLLNSKAFVQDRELTKQIIEMVDSGDVHNHPLGVILISPNQECLLCGGKLLVRADRPSHITLYTDSMVTVPATQYYKYCNKSRGGCKFMQHYGYYSNGEPTCIFYNNDWATLQYFVSSQQTAFQLSMLKKYDAELLIGQVSYNQKADIYNLSNGYDTTKKTTSAQFITEGCTSQTRYVIHVIINT